MNITPSSGSLQKVLMTVTTRKLTIEDMFSKVFTGQSLKFFQTHLVSSSLVLLRGRDWKQSVFLSK